MTVGDRTPGQRGGFRPRILLAAMVLVGVGLVVRTTEPVVARATLPEGEPIDDDRDRDGVIDALDNCLTFANPSQRDTDRDGTGNRCDADFDQDGRVGVRDVARIVHALGTADADADLDESGRVGAADLRLGLFLLGRPPGPRLDSDRDGVPDADDRCPASVASAAAGPPSGGCTTLDLVLDAETLAAPLDASLAELRDEAGRFPEAPHAAAHLAESAAQLQAAVTSAGDGDLCAAARTLAAVQAAMREAAADLDAALARARELAACTPSRGPGADVTPDQERGIALHSAVTRVRALARAARDLTVPFEMRCPSAATFQRRATVLAIDDAARVLTTTDGARYAMSRGGRIGPAVYPGRGVDMSGVSFEPGTGVVTDVSPAGDIDPGQPDLTVECVRLRIAPVQLLPPFLPSWQSVLLHEPDGYESGGVLRLEGGMALGAASTCQVFGRRFSLRIELSYTTISQVARHVVLAPDLDRLDGVVRLPGDIDPGDSATLTTTSQVQICEPACGDPAPLVVRTYPVQVAPMGTRCSVVYADGTEYDVNDQVAGDYRTTSVASASVLHPHDGGAPLTFAAQGYAVLGGQPSFPAAVTVLEGQPFAIRNTDFYPIFPDPGSVLSLVANRTTGVRWAAGLRWPRIHGTRNGRPFRFACTLPRIVRDVVGFCPQTTAFYRLPFLQSQTGWVQGQGNDGQFSHAGGFAYDMSEELGEPIHAARAGRVVSMDESEYRQCLNKECWGNYVYLQHQDGSIGQYNHFPQDGIEPQTGDLVRRGQLVGVVGLTGFTTSPHLHFAARYAIQDLTRLALFDALTPPPVAGNPRPCYEPLEGDLLRSNTQPWP